MAKIGKIEDIGLVCSDCRKPYMTYRFSIEDQTACPPCIQIRKLRKERELHRMFKVA